MSAGINMRAALEEVLMNLIRNITLDVTLWKLLFHLPNINELIISPVHQVGQ